MTASATRTGILFLLAGIAIFSLQDVVLKLMSQDYPLWQAMILRSATAVPLHLLIVFWLDGRLSTIATSGWPLMLLQGLLNCIAYSAYYLGLARLPMPETVALFFTAPLFIAFCAAVFFRERVGAPTVLALLAGVAGVLMILRPGMGIFDPAALFPVAGAIGYALQMLAARVLGRRQTAAAMAFWGSVMFFAFSLTLAFIFGDGQRAGAGGPALEFMTRGWKPLTLAHAGLFAVCGVISAVGLVLLTSAYRMAPSSRVTPFEYSFIFWAVLWGWTIWGDWPLPSAWVGIAVLIGAGLVVIRNEASKKAAPEGAALS